MRAIVEMILLLGVLLYLTNSACPQGTAASRTCNDTDIRLAEGRNEFEGRVEVCYWGQWGAVCDDSWDTRDAIVACRQLNLTSEYAIAISEVALNNNGTFGPGTGPIFLDEVNCQGYETNLDDCTHSKVGVSDCDHNEEAGVFCPQVAACNNTDIRLVGGRNNSKLEGRVEVCLQGQWGTVCNDFWDTKDAIVACRQLGLNTEYAAPIKHGAYFFGHGIGPIFLDDVGCRGDETNLDDCPHNILGVHNCWHYEDAGVICLEVEICNDTDIRLVEGRTNFQGRVEVCLQGQWGTVCDDSWDTRDAIVACRQLGLNTENAVAVNVDSGIFGPGVDPIFLDDVGCRGNETNLADCTHRGVGDHNCQSHNKDAGVICSPTPSNDTTTSTSIIGGSVGGALIVMFLLLTLVVVMAVVVVQRKKTAAQKSKVLAGGINQQDSSCVENDNTQPQIKEFMKNDDTTNVEENLSVRNPYSHHNPSSLLHPDASTGKLHRVSSSYIRKLSERMLISQKNIKLLKCIGQGEFGVVYKAQLAEREAHSSFKIVAVKTLKGYFDVKEVNAIMEESVKMKQFKHPNVMNLIGVCMDAGPAPYIVMPFMANGSLLSYLRKERPNLILDETADEDSVIEVKKSLTVMCSQIASGMEYLTKESFIHRDLATRNCMIDAHFVIKITDFGLTEDIYSRNYFRQGQWLAVKLPVKWMAPESLQDGVFSDKTDVWSFGVTCWEIFSGGKTPYPGVDPLSLIQLLENGRRLDKPANSACPDEMYSIMLKCWNSDPIERPSFSTLVKFISGFAEKTAGYLDVSNYNPFEANITPGEEHSDVLTEEEHVEVPLDDLPVESNVQCPSEDESSRDDLLL